MGVIAVWISWGASEGDEDVAMEREGRINRPGGRDRGRSPGTTRGWLCDRKESNETLEARVGASIVQPRAGRMPIPTCATHCPNPAAGRGQATLPYRDSKLLGFWQVAPERASPFCENAP